MSIETFLEKLAKTSEHFGVKWEINGYFGLRLFGSSGHYYCPITAVYLMCYEEFYAVDQWDLAGKLLGLSELSTTAILDAADSIKTYDENTKEWVNTQLMINETLQRKMLKAVGIGKD